ncbi:collagen alpha-1(I) chain-like [Panthera leo]|uniref:collagen alpha-1(I) chain-like n=1 Tax=Panthera leo TaxID=9689 RepID=UPI001C69B228|nr:collagen alpha-1(I) chain-like [Panthera leo]
MSNEIQGDAEREGSHRKFKKRWAPGLARPEWRSLEPNVHLQPPKGGRGDLCPRPRRPPPPAVRATFPAAGAGRGGAAGDAGRAAGKAGARAHRRDPAPNGSAGSARGPGPRAPRPPSPAARTRARSGRTHSPRGIRGRGECGAQTRAAPQRRAAVLGPPPPRGLGRWRRPARALPAPQPPPARRAPARGRNFLKGTGSRNRRLPGPPHLAGRPQGPSRLRGKGEFAAELSSHPPPSPPGEVTGCKF